MLRENPKQRPNVYQVLREACMMQGIEVPIKDVRSSPTLGRIATYMYRYILGERNRKQDATRHYHPCHPKRHLLPQWVPCSHHQYSRSQ